MSTPELPSPKQPPGPTFIHTPLSSPICRFALPLLVEMDNEWIVMGTCVMFHPGLALTAKHVAEECLRHFQRISMRSLDDGTHLDATFTMRAVEFREKAGAVMWWGHKVFCSPHSDIAIISMQPLFEGWETGTGLALNIVGPPVGHRVSAIGYPQGKVTVGETVEVLLDPRTTSGDVIELHLRGRDARLPFPCFRINARVDAGMSGGPVFDAAGFLCGIMSSTLAATCEGEEHVSYVAALWPLLAMELDIRWEAVAEGAKFRVRDLAERGVINARHWERVHVLGDGRLEFDGRGI